LLLAVTLLIYYSCGRIGMIRGTRA